jgi:single-strand DNA-binding protein
MGRGVNKVILVGNVGADPMVNRKENFIVVNLSLATSSSWIEKQTGEKKENVEWHKIVFFNKVAEIVDQYVCKGDKIYVGGSLRTRKYIDKKDGIERYITEIVASEMQMLGNKKPDSENQHEENPYLKKQDSQSSAETQYANNQQQLDDDIPF